MLHNLLIINVYCRLDYQSAILICILQITFVFNKLYNTNYNLCYCFHVFPLDDNTLQSKQVEVDNSIAMELSTDNTNDVLTTTSEISSNKIQENTGIALIKE
jgi:hypothetical protein